MIDTTNIPAKIYDANLSTPNLYYVTIASAETGVHHLYVAADSSRGASAKVKRHCREHLGFVAIRSTCDTKMRRFRLGDYLENPSALQKARELAALNNERDVVRALDDRHKLVMETLASMMEAEEEQADMQWAQLESALGDELRQVG